MRLRWQNVKGDHFDMLPFISILMCTLGCLLLVTMSMAMLNVGPAVGEGWQLEETSAAGTKKKPVLIEWDGKTTIIHLRDRLLTTPGDKIPFSILKDFETKRDSEYVLIAVRPTGFDSFNNFADQFRKLGISVGYEPISQSRRVRLIEGDSRK